MTGTVGDKSEDFLPCPRQASPAKDPLLFHFAPIYLISRLDATPTYARYQIPSLKKEPDPLSNIAKGTTDPRIEFILPK